MVEIVRFAPQEFIDNPYVKQLKVEHGLSYDALFAVWTLFKAQQNELQQHMPIIKETT